MSDKSLKSCWRPIGNCAHSELLIFLPPLSTESYCGISLVLFCDTFWGGGVVSSALALADNLKCFPGSWFTSSIVYGWGSMGPNFCLLFLQFHPVCLLTSTTKNLRFSLSPYLPPQKVPVNHSVRLEKWNAQRFFSLKTLMQAWITWKHAVPKWFPKTHVCFSAVPFGNAPLAQELTAIPALQRCQSREKAVQQKWDLKSYLRRGHHLRRVLWGLLPLSPCLMRFQTFGCHRIFGTYLNQVTTIPPSLACYQSKALGICIALERCLELRSMQCQLFRDAPFRGGPFRACSSAVPIPAARPDSEQPCAFLALGSQSSWVPNRQCFQTDILVSPEVAPSLKEFLGFVLLGYFFSLPGEHCWMTTLMFVKEFSNFTRKAWFGGSICISLQSCL